MTQPDYSMIALGILSECSLSALLEDLSQNDDKFDPVRQEFTFLELFSEPKNIWKRSHWFLCQAPAPCVLQAVIVLPEEKLLWTTYIERARVKRLNLLCERKIHLFSNSLNIPFKFSSRIRFLRFDFDIPTEPLLLKGCNGFISSLKHST